MLVRCQRLASEPGGNRVTGGERLTSSLRLIKIGFYHEAAEQKTKRIHTSRAVLQYIYRHSAETVLR